MQCTSSSSCWLPGRNTGFISTRSDRNNKFRRINAAVDPSRGLELPGGTMWWLHKIPDTTVEPMNIQNWVFHRHHPSSDEVSQTDSVALEIFNFAQQSGPVSIRPPITPMGLALTGVVVIDTEFEILPPADAHLLPLLPPPVDTNTTCTGMVYIGTTAANDTSKHPRRTSRLRFTCNLCGECSEKAVNPLAWSKGSVFARCDGCSAVHKLKDNLKIFHELKGPVFPPRELRDSFPAVKEILERIEAKQRLQPPSEK